MHPDQTNSYIHDNMALIGDILDLFRVLGIKTGLISLDQEKAFDRVEHSYLYE